MPSIALGLRRDTYKHDFWQLWYTLVHHFLSDPSPIIALPCLSLSWVSQFRCVNFLQPCCRRWNKTKSMLLMPEQSQTHVFINFYLTQPSPMVALPKGQFGRKRLQHQQFFAYRLHCIRLCHPNEIYLLLILIPCLLWDLTDMTQAKIHATSPCLTLQNLAKPNLLQVAVCSKFWT